MPQILRGLLTREQQLRLEELAPTHFTVPTGSRIRIDYRDELAPVVAVRLQEVFGVLASPRLAGGRVPVTFKLLSPAQRPVQITRDLASFWQGSYADVRKDMRGRYPRHYWPEDPAIAEPTRRAKPPGRRQTEAPERLPPRIAACEYEECNLRDAEVQLSAQRLRELMLWHGKDEGNLPPAATLVESVARHHCRPGSAAACAHGTGGAARGAGAAVLDLRLQRDPPQPARRAGRTAATSESAPGAPTVRAAGRPAPNGCRTAVAARGSIQAIRAHLIRVAMLGGLPCMSSAILNTLAANQTTSAEVTQLMSSVVHTCQAGGGALDATRAIMAKVLTGGMKLIATLNVEFGACPMNGRQCCSRRPAGS